MPGFSADLFRVGISLGGGGGAEMNPGPSASSAFFIFLTQGSIKLLKQGLNLQSSQPPEVTVVVFLRKL